MATSSLFCILFGASEEITNTSPLTLTRDQLPVDVNSNQAMPIGHPIDLRPRPLLIFHSLPLAFGTAIPELRLRGVIFLELSPRVFSDSAQSHLARFMFVESRISPNPAASRTKGQVQADRSMGIHSQASAATDCRKRSKPNFRFF